MDWKGSDYSWSRASILMNAPNFSGVYVVWNGEGCIYVGETHDLQRRLLDHFDNPPRCMIEGTPPTAFGFEICSVDLRTRRSSFLSLALRPRCTDC
jgi:hypothetical protein